jgi:hypothetical protein
LKGATVYAALRAQGDIVTETVAGLHRRTSVPGDDSCDVVGGEDVVTASMCESWCLVPVSDAASPIGVGIRDGLRSSMIDVGVSPVANVVALGQSDPSRTVTS